MIAEILRLVAVGEMVARRQEQVVVRGLRDAAAEVIAGGGRALLNEDALDVFEPVAGETGARERGLAAAVDRIGVAEIDRLVLREIPVER